MSDERYWADRVLIEAHRIGFPYYARKSLRSAIRRRANYYKIYVRSLDRKSTSFRKFVEVQGYVARLWAFLRACEVGERVNDE